MLRYSQICAMLVVCAVVCGRAEAKNSMFEEICDSIAARDQDSSSERSIHTSRITPSTVGDVSCPLRRSIRACWLVWSSLSREPSSPRYVCIGIMCNCEVEFMAMGYGQLSHFHL